MNTVIKVNNLFKRFLIGTNERFTLFQTIRYKLSGENPLKEIWALKNINFEVKKGEMVSIIGPNGSGKSTLLKILAGIIKPTFGTFEVNGNVSTIFELGLGFNPRFTALENIYLYAALHGVTKKEINKQLDAILEFAELKDFVGARLNDFSSGMRARLAFATVIQNVGEIILIDEVLSVGDIAFQKKCLKVFENLLNNGHTIISVTHNIDEAKNLCKKALYLDKGEQICFGNVDEVNKEYIKNIEAKSINTKNVGEFVHNNLQDYTKDINDFNFLYKYLQKIGLGIISLLKKENFFFILGFLFPFFILFAGVIIDNWSQIKKFSIFKHFQTKEQIFENAIQLRNSGNYLEAESLLKKITISDPDNINYNMALIETLTLQQKFDEAINLAKKILDNNPQNLVLNRLLANIYFEQNNFELAEQIYSKLLELSKVENNKEELKNAYISLAKIYVIQGNKKLASKIMKEAKKNFPELNDYPDISLIQTTYQ